MYELQLPGLSVKSKSRLERRDTYAQFYTST